MSSFWVNKFKRIYFLLVYKAFVVAEGVGSRPEEVSETVGKPVEYFVDFVGVGHLEKVNQLFNELIFG